MPNVDTHQAHRFDKKRLALIDDWMDRYIAEKRFAGTSILLAQNGEVVHLSALGQRSIEDDLPFQTDTIVRVYSMTKMVTSVALMMLLEKGLVHLDAPIDRFIPEFSNCTALRLGARSVGDVEPARCPTISEVLTHTSGLTYGFNEGVLPEHYAKSGIDFGPGTGGLDAATKRAAKAPLAFQPGSRWEYSIGIDIIGRIVEIISGKSLEAFLKDHIFDPLGMVDTSFALPTSKVDRFADCYAKADTNPLMRYDVASKSEFLEGNVQTFSGGGGLLSTLDDFFRFAEMIRLEGSSNGEKLLSHRTVKFMQRNHLTGDIASMGPSSFAEMPMRGMGFGIGGAVVLDPALARVPGSIGDFGWGGMASTFFWTDPIEQLTCVFFTQLIPSSSYSNRAELKALVHGALCP